MTDYLVSTFDLSAPEAVAAYDELPLWSSYAGALLFRFLPMTPGMRVLDVGCGTGFPTLELAGRLGLAAAVTGIDVWDAALERARAKALAHGVENANFRRANAAALPFEDGSFDFVVSNVGLNNVGDGATAVRECARVLTPAGGIAITTNLQGHMQEFYAVFDEVLASGNHAAARERLAEHVGHRGTVAGVEELLVAGGLTLSRVEQSQERLRFADGGARLRHYFIRLGFLDAWKDVVDPEDRTAVFQHLEARLDASAAGSGALALTVPFAYIEARRA